jgi:hypothetical protein
MIKPQAAGMVLALSATILFGAGIYVGQVESKVETITEHIVVMGGDLKATKGHVAFTVRTDSPDGLIDLASIDMNYITKELTVKFDPTGKLGYQGAQDSQE